MQGQNGYVNGVDELNRICSIYGTGQGATGARSINVDDINWITGYNPNNVGVKDSMQTGNGRRYYEDKMHEYGNSVKYTLLSTGVKYEPTNSAKAGTSTMYKQFTSYNEVSKSWENLTTNENVTLESSLYEYYPTTLTETNDINATVGIASMSLEYKMLFTNSGIGADGTNGGKIENFIYWIGSKYISTDEGCATFGIRRVNEGCVYAYGLSNSNSSESNPCSGVRPVVSLDQKVRLKDSGTMKDGCKLYNMQVK